MSTEEAPPRITWLARAGALFVRALGRTWRIKVTHDEEVRRLRSSGQPIVFTLWHGQMLPLLYHHRGEQVSVLISEHADGEIIARIAMALGYRTVRGSTSRGAARALLGLTREIERGFDLAITPDGPRGPAKSVAGGGMMVAQRSGAPLIGAAATASRAWHLKSWDRFMIPRPFARVHIAYSDADRIEVTDKRSAGGGDDPVRRAMDVAEQRAGV